MLAPEALLRPRLALCLPRAAPPRSVAARLSAAGSRGSGKRLCPGRRCGPLPLPLPLPGRASEAQAGARASPGVAAASVPAVPALPLPLPPQPPPPPACSGGRAPGSAPRGPAPCGPAPPRRGPNPCRLLRPRAVFAPLGALGIALVSPSRAASRQWARELSLPPGPLTHPIKIALGSRNSLPPQPRPATAPRGQSRSGGGRHHLLRSAGSGFPLCRRCLCPESEVRQWRAASAQGVGSARGGVRVPPGELGR